jgi:dCTP deaminase
MSGEHTHPTHGVGLLESSDIFHRVINEKGSQRIGITPWEQERLQPASYEMALGSKFRVFSPVMTEIDPEFPGDYTQLIDIDDNEQEWYDQGYYLLLPGEFILGSSVETFTFPSDVAGELTGKSSIGRLGLQVHATAGFFDPGFRGTATLEISNLARVPIRLRSGLVIAQMRFVTLSRPSEWAYGHPSRHSHYQGQNGPTPSRHGSRLTIKRPEEVPEQIAEQLQIPGEDWSKYERHEWSGTGH